MPDISKINALAIGSVGKVDGLAKASILDINGVAVPSGIAPLFDSYPAEAGYSVRLLSTTYKTGGGSIMRVRRASDNVEADVGFDASDEFGLTSPISNTSDAQSYTDFADFVDHTGTPTTAFCRTWYDQSGNGYDAQQSTANSQPRIYDGSNIELVGGKPALTDNNVDSTTLMTIPAYGSSSSTGAIFTVNTPNFARSVIYGQGLYYAASESTGALQLNFGNFITGSAATVTQRLQTYLLGTTDYGYINGTLNVSGDAGSQTIGNSGTIGSRGTNFWDQQDMQEVIVYLIDRTSVRTDIESNIMTHFSLP